MSRPSFFVATEQPKKFQRVYEEDGIVSTWTYDLDIFPNGPIDVTNDYPEGYVHPNFDEENDKLPITQQKFLNPANGKMVAYGRAKQLKLI